MNNTLIHSGPSRLIDKAKYQRPHQNASDVKGVYGNAVSNEGNPSLLLQPKSSRGLWNFKCITKLGRWRLFVKRENGADPGTIIEDYEVVRIRKVERDKILPSGKVIPKGKVLYPGNKQWGTDGFSYPTLKLAQAKFLEMTQKEEAGL